MSHPSADVHRRRQALALWILQLTDGNKLSAIEQIKDGKVNTGPSTSIATAPVSGPYLDPITKVQDLIKSTHTSYTVAQEAAKQVSSIVGTVGVNQYQELHNRIAEKRKEQLKLLTELGKQAAVQSMNTYLNKVIAKLDAQITILTEEKKSREATNRQNQQLLLAVKTKAQQLKELVEDLTNPAGLLYNIKLAELVNEFDKIIVDVVDKDDPIISTYTGILLRYQMSITKKVAKRKAATNAAFNKSETQLKEALKNYKGWLIDKKRLARKDKRIQLFLDEHHPNWVNESTEVQIAFQDIFLSLQELYNVSPTAMQIDMSASIWDDFENIKRNLAQLVTTKLTDRIGSLKDHCQFLVEVADGISTIPDIDRQLEVKHVVKCIKTVTNLCIITGVPIDDLESTISRYDRSYIPDSDVVMEQAQEPVVVASTWTTEMTTAWQQLLTLSPSKK